MADILLGNVKGPQGNTGATGSQGPRGDAATITVGTVSTTAYGNTASVTNSGTEQDAVLDFVIPQGKPGEQTTRMGALTLDTITAQSADFPIPAVGETGSTVFGKIIKFFNSTVSALNSKLNISDVVNNLTSTSTTQPLSAAQGKALNDALGTTNSNVSGVSGRVTTLENRTQYNTTSFGVGTNKVTLTDALGIRSGNIVTITARIKINEAISGNAMDVPLVVIPSELISYAPVTTYQPNIMSATDSSGSIVGVWACLGALYPQNGRYYIRQKAMTTLPAGMVMNFFYTFATS